MKKTLLTALSAALLALMPFSAPAQTVVQAPIVVAARTVVDLSNGPTEIRVLQGNMGLFTSQGSGVGSGSTTTITLTATPAIPPCVGCLVSGAGVTSGTTVTAFNGTTTITTNTSQTIAASTALSWGAACPAAPPSAPLALVQAAVGADIPMYTQARVCAYGGSGPSATILQFAIGAH